MSHLHISTGDIYTGLVSGDQTDSIRTLKEGG